MCVYGAFMICAVNFSFAQVPKAVKVLLSHQAGPELIRLSDQWGRNCLHHAAAAVRHHVISLHVLQIP